jgi:hypothetical protein
MDPCQQAIICTLLEAVEPKEQVRKDILLIQVGNTMHAHAESVPIRYEKEVLYYKNESS